MEIIQFLEDCIDKDKKDPTSDNYYPDVALLARQKSMVHKKKMADLTKTGVKIRARHMLGGKELFDILTD